MVCRRPLRRPDRPRPPPATVYFRNMSYAGKLLPPILPLIAPPPPILHRRPIFHKFHEQAGCRYFTPPLLYPPPQAAGFLPTLSPDTTVEYFALTHVAHTGQAKQKRIILKVPCVSIVGTVPLHVAPPPQPLPLYTSGPNAPVHAARR